MNLNTTNFAVNPCVVCEYLFADKHHIWPQAKGGEKLPTVSLCPNHHRYANIVQAMLLQGRLHNEIEVFAYQHFDQVFNEVMLAFLMEEQRVSWQGWGYYYQDQLRQAIARNDRIGAIKAAIAMANAIAGPDLDAIALDDATYEALATYRRDREPLESVVAE